MNNKLDHLGEPDRGAGEPLVHLDTHLGKVCWSIVYETRGFGHQRASLYYMIHTKFMIILIIIKGFHSERQHLPS